MSELKYSEEDLDFDCDIFISETEDINVNWLGDFVIISKREVPTKQLEVLNSFNAHTKTLRLLNGINAALDVEANNCSVLSINNVHQPFQQEVRTAVSYTLNDLPFTESVGDIPNIDNMISRNDSAESIMRQLKKDVERDTMLINGNRLAGAQVGLTQTLRRVSDFCNELITECGCPFLSSHMSESLSKAILSKASRTHAGGITFQSLQALIDPSSQMLIPQSSSAVPLNVQIHVGAFPDVYYQSRQRNASTGASTAAAQLKAWGVVCCVQCESVFQIQSREIPLDESEDPLSPSSGMSSKSGAAAPLVKVLYRDYVLLDLKLSSAELNNAENIISDSKELGTVTLSYN